MMPRGLGSAEKRGFGALTFILRFQIGDDAGGNLLRLAADDDREGRHGHGGES